MSDEKALLAAIWEHPHEDTPRLMYADWLDEHDQAPRAELIRVQVELAGLSGDDPRYDALEAKDETLLAAWQKGWWKAMPVGARRGTFRRGFPVPDLGQFKIPGLVKLDEKRLRAAPLWRYHYGVYSADFDALIRWPCLHRLERFALQSPPLNGWAEKLAGCENTRNVTELALMECAVSANELTLLLDAWAGRSLRDLRLHLDADGLQVLADHPTTAKLRSLDLAGSGLTTDTLKFLTRSRYLTGLLSLSLGYNRFGDEGLTEILRWPGLRKLRGLMINQNRLTDSGMGVLASCSAAANLRWLWLSMNGIGSAGAIAIATSPHLANLKRVAFYGNPAFRVPEAEAALRKRFGRGNY